MQFLSTLEIIELIMQTDGAYEIEYLTSRLWESNDLQFQGWGCGYRTLQTISSWVKLNKQTSAPVPSLQEIQKTLVNIEDKETSFIGSRTWIGSFEVITDKKKLIKLLKMAKKKILVGWRKKCYSRYRSLKNTLPCATKDLQTFTFSPTTNDPELLKIELIYLKQVCLVLDERYGIPSKIIHVSSGKNLEEQVPILKKHFEQFGSPIMMGGDEDCSSKGIVGIHVGKENTYLLVVDPHFVGRARSPEQLQRSDWVKWQNLNDFIDSSFYNLCLPQIGSFSDWWKKLLRLLYVSLKMVTIICIIFMYSLINLCLVWDRLLEEPTKKCVPWSQDPLRKPNRHPLRFFGSKLCKLVSWLYSVWA